MWGAVSNWYILTVCSMESPQWAQGQHKAFRGGVFDPNTEQRRHTLEVYRHIRRKAVLREWCLFMITGLIFTDFLCPRGIMLVCAGTREYKCSMYSNGQHACECDGMVRYGAGNKWTAYKAVNWAPECGGRNGFPPPEKNELVLSIEMGCADTMHFQSKPNTPF